MLLGAVVVKPRMDYVLAYPDIYRNNQTYVACAIDFSDLADIVRKVVRNWQSYSPLRRRAQELVLEEVNPEKFTRRFWSQLCDVVEKGSVSSRYNSP